MLIVPRRASTAIEMQPTWERASRMLMFKIVTEPTVITSQLVEALEVRIDTDTSEGGRHRTEKTEKQQK